MNKDLNGPVEIMLLSEGEDITSEEADLLGAGLALREFVDEHRGETLSDVDSACLAALLLEWTRCRRVLDGIPEARLRFLHDASRPKVVDGLQEWWAREARRALRRAAGRA